MAFVVLICICMYSSPFIAWGHSSVATSEINDAALSFPLSVSVALCCVVGINLFRGQLSVCPHQLPRG